MLRNSMRIEKDLGKIYDKTKMISRQIFIILRCDRFIRCSILIINFKNRDRYCITYNLIPKTLLLKHYFHLEKLHR